MLKIFLFLVTIVVFILPLFFASILPGIFGHQIYRLFYKVLCGIANVDIELSGELPKEKPVLFVSNHVSYLDILILGTVLPASFISKAEVSKWPIIGLLGKLTGAVFIDRRPAAAGGHLDQLRNALAKGRNLILFAEGTTGDGVKILPFKSSLFKIAEESKLTVQPLKIEYTKINGLPVQRNEQSLIAWIGDMDLAPHLKTLLGLGAIKVRVTLQEPLEKTQDRKKIAHDCWKSISS